MTGEIVEFPGRELPPEGYSEQYIEEGICDCATMAKSAAQMVLAQDDGTNRKLIFAVATSPKCWTRSRPAITPLGTVRRRGLLHHEAPATIAQEAQRLASHARRLRR